MKRPRQLINIFSLLLILSFSCGTEKFIEPEYLNTPLNLTAYAQNHKIKLKFFSSNKESTFDGFNVYISRNSSLRSQGNLLPLKNPRTGSVPTMDNSSRDIILGQTIEIVFDRDENDNPLENGVKYYFIVKAHSLRNFRSEPSNEASTTPRPDDLTGVTLSQNEGFNFNTLSKQAPFHFILEIIDSKKYLLSQNASVLEPKGYYAQWEEVNQSDDTGYLPENTPLLVQPGYVFLLKTPENKYGKIQVVQVNDTSITIIWAFQNNPNNKDI